jgi:hypothetical protein
MIKWAFAQTEMRAKFLTSRCSEKGNPKDFLKGLRLKKEELAQAGVKISEEDYLLTIISSLPDSLSTFASIQMSWSSQNGSQQMDASTLMNTLIQEAERQNQRNQRRKQTAGKGKEDEKNEALAVSADKPRGRKDAAGKVLCWNCDEEGHLKNKCPKPKRSKDDPKKSVEKTKAKATASVVEATSDEDGAWASEELFVESGGDWFEEIVSDEVERMCAMCVDVDSDSDGDVGVAGVMNEPQEEVVGVVSVEFFGDTSGEAFVVAESVQTSAKAELYDSGCMNHISPYKNDFDNLQAIEPRRCLVISALQTNRHSALLARESL